MGTGFFCGSCGFYCAKMHTKKKAEKKQQPQMRIIFPFQMIIILLYFSIIA